MSETDKLMERVDQLEALVNAIDQGLFQSEGIGADRYIDMSQHGATLEWVRARSVQHDDVIHPDADPLTVT